MTWSQLLALTPLLILTLGSTALLMLGTFRVGARTLFSLGMLTAVAAALAALFMVPPVTEVAEMISVGSYGRFFTVFWSLLAFLTLAVSFRYAEDRSFAAGEYISLILFATAGMAFLSSATSLIGLFLGLEAFTLVFYILVAFHKGSVEGTEAGLKYLVLGAVATGFLAFGIALIYASSGTFHLPEAMAGLGQSAQMRPLGLLGWTMLLVALGFKVSLVPFHLWTPDVYQGAPAPVAALLSTGSKGAVFAAMVTLMAGVTSGRGDLEPLLWALAALSMTVGTFCALRQENIKRMLAYSSVVHMGYVLVALLAGGPAGEGAVLFYLVTYAITTLGAFAVLTSLSSAGHEPQLCGELRGTGYRHPLQGASLSLFLLSLAGIPPTAGFIGKFGIFHAAIGSGYVGLAVLGVLSSLVSLYYYLRPIVALYMEQGTGEALHPGSRGEKGVLCFCLAATLLLGIYPGPLWDMVAFVLP